MSKGPIAMVELRCPCCEKVFYRQRKTTHLARGNKGTFCTRDCRTQFYKWKRMNHNQCNVDMLYRMGRNVIREFKVSHDEYEEKFKKIK